MKFYGRLKRKKLFIVLFILCIFLINFALITNYILSADLELKGSYNIEIEYPNRYLEPGYTAKLFDKDYSSKVTVDSNLNEFKIGEYQITYSINYGFTKKTKVRTIKVVDKESPVITLKGESEINICKNTKYVEDGYEAIDNYDGDLSDDVTISTEGDYYVYSVTDTSNNTSSVKRKVTKEDKESPTIKLIGGSSVSLTVGGEYIEQGYKAEDNCDGNLTDKVSVSGTVDTKTVGTYTLTYSVSDSENNKAEVSRKVVVKEVIQTQASSGKAGVIYLTFDDGPGAGTAKILDVLKKYNVKATFFVTCSGSDDLIVREYNEGHTVALHTASHVYKTVYSSVEGYYDDLNKVSTRVKNLTGYESKIIRFPGGSSNTVSKSISKGIMSTLTKDVLSKGYHYFDWNVDSDDAGSCVSKRTSSCVYNNVIKGLSKSRSNVVLMHDIKTYTANAIEDIVKYGINNGYKFEAITMDTPMVRHSVNN